MKDSCIFIGSYFSSDDLPEKKGKNNVFWPDIVLLGRSNVGKSSLINHWQQNKTLAKVSSRPGKTQCINFFELNNQCFLVDLPGYGFAKQSLAKQKAWSELIDTYLYKRPTIALCLLLIDSRHDLQENDKNMLFWLHKMHRPFAIIFTKTDKLSLPQLEKQTKKNLLLIEKLINFKPEFVYYSIQNSTGSRKLNKLLDKTLKNWQNIHG